MGFFALAKATSSSLRIHGSAADVLYAMAGMRYGTRVPSVFAAIISLAACNAPHTPTAATAIPTVKGLQAQIQDLKDAYGLLESRVAVDESDIRFNRLSAQSDRTAFLTPGTNGYSLIRSDLGIMTVALADVKPYANGSKIRLQFGNTLVAAIDGLKFTLDWGRMTPSGQADESKVRTRELSSPQPLLSGAWTTVEIVLDGTPPSNLDFVRVKDVTHTGISLKK